MASRSWHRFYDPRVPPDLTFDEVTLSDMLRESATRFPDRPALTFRNRTLSYREFQDQVDRLATALTAFGVRQGDRVGIQLPNLPQTVIAIFATLRLGAITVMTNPLYTVREVEHQWKDAGVSVAIVMDFIYAARLAPARKTLGVEHFVVASIPEYLGFPLNLLAPLKLRRSDPPMIARVPASSTVHHFKVLIRKTAPQPPTVTIALDDVAMLQYTGGTTGVSKGAMLTHRNLSANTQQVVRFAPDLKVGEEVWLGVLPYFHIYGITVAMLSPVYLGAEIVLIPNPRDIAGMVDAVEKRRVTQLSAVPAMYNAINQFPGVERRDLSHVAICNSGSAPLPVDVLERFEALTGATISEGYGLTETSPVTHSNPCTGVRKKGSIGIPLPNTDAKIVDPEDGVTERPPGEPGELLLRGPQVMQGYWQQEEATAMAIRDGWFYTGDLATRDEDGYFTIVGRKKDMILCSGYNVYPDEIDRVLMSHPAVLEAATIGVPDERRGETVKSFIVLTPGHEVTAEELDAFCRDNLAAYKVPREFAFRDSIPKSTVLKILRRELREEELQKRAATG